MFDYITVSSMSLFNLLQRKFSTRARDEVLVVDCRDFEKYKDQHIIHSVSIPTTSHRDLSYIFEEIPIPTQKTKLEYEKLKKLHTIVLVQDLESTSWPKLLSSLLTRSNFSVCLLSESIETFSAQYPFLMTSSEEDIVVLQESKSGIFQISGEGEEGNDQVEKKEIGYPTEIMKGFLYLGRAEHANSPEIVSTLNITHIVCIHNENVQPSNPHKGIIYHNISLNDNYSSPISQHFDAFLEFMDNMKSSQGMIRTPSDNLSGSGNNNNNNNNSGNIQNEENDTHLKKPKCLIHCDLGISRSPSFTILYLMIKNKIPLNQAERFVSSQHIDCYPNKGLSSSSNNLNIDIKFIIK